MAVADPAGSEATVEHCLFGRFPFLTTRLPQPLARQAQAGFDKVWALHPAAFYQMRQPGTGATIPVPRWQQAYGRDYRYSGNVNRALPVPAIIEPYLSWARAAVDARLNGYLLNWYDAGLSHRIGAHRDSTAGLVEGSPIVTISLGAARVFRLWSAQDTGAQDRGHVDFEAAHGSVFVLPWETNRSVKHGVPHRASDTGRRISITLRAFAA